MNRSVLVIDDDPRICQLICRGFEREGYSVFQASDGRDGLKIFQAERPDLVITDILMPEMEGIETIMHLRSAAWTPKIIAISGGGRLVGREFLKWAKRLGADEVLAKPFRVSALVSLAAELTDPGDEAAPPAAPYAAPLQNALRLTSEAITEGWETLLDRHNSFAAA
jgi:DNA-binding response OmpR family regulator